MATLNAAVLSPPIAVATISTRLTLKPSILAQPPQQSSTPTPTSTEQWSTS